MSYQTITVSDVANSYVGFGATIDQRVACARNALFDFDYPYPDEQFRASLESAIIVTYWEWELCRSPLYLWKMYARNKLNLIMPYYVKLWESAQVEYDILNDIKTVNHSEGSDENVNHSETSGKSGATNHSTSSSGTAGSGTSSNTRTDDLRNHSDELGSDFPQATLNTSIDYGSTGRRVDGTNTGTQENSGSTTSHVEVDSWDNSESSGTNSSTGDSKGTGKSSSDSTSVTNNANRAERIMAYRNTLLRIEQDIVNEMRSLFYFISEF